jgi:hypothetical protein
MFQEFALVNSMNQKIWKNRTKIISVFEQNGLRMKVFQKLERTDIHETMLKWFKQRRSDSADCVWNVMAHAQQPDLVFWRNGRVHLNRRGHHFSRPLAAEVCASAGVTLDTSWSEVVWGVLATHSIRQFSLHFPSRASPCAITFQLDSTSQQSTSQDNFWSS